MDLVTRERPAIDRWLPWVAVALALAVRLLSLTRYPLWFDELFAVELALRSPIDLLRGAIADHTNPPLFYLLLAAWSRTAGASDAALRLLPALLGAAAAFPLVRLGRRCSMDGAGLALLTAVSATAPALVALSLEVRAYALALLLSACFVELALRGDRERLTLAVGIALVHTHYFGWFVVLGAALASRDAWPRTARIGLAFLPWALAVAWSITQSAAPGATTAWLPAPTVDAVLQLPLFLIAGSGWRPLDLAIAGIVITLTTIAARRADQPSARPLVLTALLPIGALLIASLFRPSFAERYLIVGAPAACVLLALGLQQLLPRAHRARAVATVALVTLIALNNARVRRTTVEKFDWRDFTAQLRPDVAPTIYAFEGFTALPLAWYAAPHRVASVHTLGEIRSRPAWLVVRDGYAPPLDAFGDALHLIAVDSAPGQRIRAYRLDAR
ncbi:MAG: hypothetical protein K2X99_10815 [Gemmatimonadaceae bacterium]|nr:hypothetical protein [Gemmatimonadaceae bacterium]